MRLNTIVTLGASAAFGLMAIFLAQGWIDEAIQEEFRDVRPEAPIAAVKAEPTRSVVIADHDLSFGQTLTPQSLRVVNYPEDAFPEGAFETLDDIFTANASRTIVLTQMRINEPIMDYKISGPNGKGSLSALIGEGYRAVAIEIDEVSGVGGFIVPGDYVDVLYLRYPEAKKSSREQDMVADVLLQNIKVLGVDQNNNPESRKAELASTVTLEVTNEDAQRLHLAIDKGQLSLTLRGIGQTVVAPEPTLQTSTRGPRRVGTVRAYGAAKAVPSKAAPSTSAQVTIIRGQARDEVTVLREEDSQETGAQELAGG